ncbi:MAG: DUF805 domain-containing protein [Sedimentisphaerales bacterium]|jgi:uncharacterized membrane protein YhaH (DUF805 family)
MKLNFLSYRGRIGRAWYIFYQLLAGILFFAWSAIITIIANLFAFTGIENDNVNSLFGFMIFIGLLVLYLPPTIKRFHDLNLSGSYVWFFVIPLVNIYYWFLLLFQEGTLGPNKYGEDPIQYKTLKDTIPNRIQFHTPPRWDSWRRYVALALAIISFFLCYQISFLQIRDDMAHQGFSFFDILLLWPLIPLWIGWFNFIGLWGYVNRVVIENNKATFYLLGFFGKEKKIYMMEIVNTFEGNWVSGMVNGKQKELFIKRKYFSLELRNELAKIGKEH